MAQGFHPSRKGIQARFTAEEADLLKRLFHDVMVALEPEEDESRDPLAAMLGIAEHAEVPTDPVLARMLPVASDDPEVADEFRRFTELSLRQQKIGHLKLAAMDLESPHITLNQEHAQAWSTALNDVRLTLAARLSIESDQDAANIAERTEWNDVETVEDYMALVYNFVTWLLDTLIESLIQGLD